MKMRSTLIAALVAGLALPAFAQDGFRVGLQVGSMKTTGDAAEFATSGFSGPTPVINTMSFDQPTQTPLTLDLAWVKGDDEFSLTYLTTKKTADKTYVNAADPVLFLGSSVPGMTGSRELKATIIDLSWKRTLIKGDTGSFAFSTGLRYSKQSDERTYLPTDGAGTPIPNADIHLKGEGTGFGLSAGLHARMNLNERFWITSGFVASLINNTTKTDDYSISLGGPSASFVSDDTHQSLLQSDAYLRLNMNIVKTFNGYLGYEVRNFNSDAARIQTPSIPVPGFSLPTTSGFGLAGFTLGLSYTF